MKPTGSPIAMAPFYSIAWGKSSRNSNWMNFVLVLIRHSFDYDGDDDDEDEKMRCSGNETDPWKEGNPCSNWQNNRLNCLIKTNIWHRCRR